MPKRMKRSLIMEDADERAAEEIAIESEEIEELVDAINRISEASEKLLKSGLSQRALILLLHDACSNVGKREIKEVLNSLPRLKVLYIESPKEVEKIG